MVVIILLVTRVLEFGRPEINQSFPLFTARSISGISNVVLPSLVSKVVDDTCRSDDIVVHVKVGEVKVTIQAALHVIGPVHLVIVIITKVGEFDKRRQ